MQTILKKILLPLLDKPFFDHFRAATGIRPPLFLRPMKQNESISDLFPWRVDEKWETQYDLMNLPSLVFPKKNFVDFITMIFFDSRGKEISRKQFELNPLETRKILIRDFLKGITGQGTFSCFHFAKGLEEVQALQGHINDRQYVSFSWKNV